MSVLRTDGEVPATPATMTLPSSSTATSVARERGRPVLRKVRVQRRSAAAPVSTYLATRSSDDSSVPLV